MGFPCSPNNIRGHEAKPYSSRNARSSNRNAFTPSTRLSKGFMASILSRLNRGSKAMSASSSRGDTLWGFSKNNTRMNAKINVFSDTVTQRATAWQNRLSRRQIPPNVYFPYNGLICNNLPTLRLVSVYCCNSDICKRRKKVRCSLNYIRHDFSCMGHGFSYIGCGFSQASVLGQETA